MNAHNTKTLKVCLLLFVMITANTCSASAQTWHQIGDQRPKADTAWINIKDRTVEICVEHKSGIGKIEFVQDDGKWPRFLRLVFHNFKALEKLKIWTKEKTFETSIKASKKTVIDLGKGFKATRKGNSIIIDGPRRFIRKMEPSIRMEWIDFYRH